MPGLIAAAVLASTPPTFIERPCTTARLAARAKCGSVTVPEDRSRPSGRKIELNVIVIPAEKPGRDRRALFDLDGGPGLADTKNADFYLTDGAAYSATRDVVSFDQRGTGGSNPLDCPEFDAVDRALQPMFPVAAVRPCRKRLEQSADLTHYATEDAVADIDAVRTALGYRKIDIFALSYGTTLALRYIDEHGASVRSAVLLSAVPPSAMPPRHHATAAQAALEEILLDCGDDAACRARFPRLRSDLTNALRVLRTNGKVDPGVAMEKLRSKLYGPAAARALPSIIHRLATGDLSGLASGDERSGLNYYDGVYLTITCSESLPWFDQNRAMSAARRTAFGDYRLARQRQACASWPRAKVKPAFFTPVRSPVPVLFLSGGRDPVTPARWATGVSRGFTHGRQIIIPWAGHIVDGLSGLDTCFDPQILRFFEAADPGAVDAKCFANMMPPAFADQGWPEQQP